MTHAPGSDHGRNKEQLLKRRWSSFLLSLDPASLITLQAFGDTKFDVLLSDGCGQMFLKQEAAYSNLGFI